MSTVVLVTGSAAILTSTLCVVFQFVVVKVRVAGVNVTFGLGEGDP